jgi:hypothetical protein
MGKVQTKGTRTEFSFVKGSDLPLSGRALIKILSAVLDKGVPVRFRTKGFSMSPFIKDKDVVTLTPLQKAPPGVGDVIAFVLQGTERLCVHRVVDKKGNLYVTKGDNSNVADESVLRENLLGFVTRVERDGKEVLLGLGPERFLIAFLGRRGLLLPLIFPFWKVIRTIMKKELH